jgi:hypothetical protein
MPDTSIASEIPKHVLMAVNPFLFRSSAKSPFSIRGTGSPFPNQDRGPQSAIRGAKPEANGKSKQPERPAQTDIRLIA